MYDFAIIGAGAAGTSIARELSRYKSRICILEKSDDVSDGASKANSGIVHGGYAAKHGTLKGQLNIIGNRMFPNLDKELNFGFRKTGGLVLGFTEADLSVLQSLYSNGLKNGVKDLRIIKNAEILSLEPHINSKVKFALHTNELGVTSPYEYTIALAENAVTNGVELLLNNEVVSIQKRHEYFIINTNRITIKTKFVINASGIYADKISAMAGVTYFNITPRKGQYVLFQKGTGKIVKRVIFQVPTEKGKGILVTSTYHGNLMIGPNSEEVSNRDDTGTDEEILEYIVTTARKSVPGVDPQKILKTFSGIRPTPDTGDFIIKEELPGFINVAGIESPGLTSSPAIAKMVVNIITNKLNLEQKKDFDPYRKAIIKTKNLSPEDVNRLIKIDSSPEKIICRCEQISEKEIFDALNRNIPVYTTYAVKKRTRAGMGKCQGRFCGPRVQEIIDRERKRTSV